jgi:hypothetical protein
MMLCVFIVSNALRNINPAIIVLAFLKLEPLKSLDLSLRL